ncbi:hypothetical protein B566_EDAN010025 [Ephemera danica]|nr:hypothetical protein B566_EDAN010025 [Ephemera danica]
MFFGPDVFSKLVAIPGDVGEEGLGLSDADRKRLIESVSIVFHSAATLDFEASLLPAEPVPGWISSTNGPSGFLMGAARGVVRRLPMGAGLIYDYIPVDMVINEMLVAACNTGTNK